MPYDPQQTTQAPKPIEPTGFFSGILFRPIVTGVIVDTLGTFVLYTGYNFLFVTKELAEKGLAGESAFAEYWLSSEGLAASLLLGSLGTLIGGFYAAFKAGTLEMKHGALVGIGSIILGLLLQTGGSDSNLPEWFMALSFAAAIPAGAMGGFFAEMLKNAKGSGASPRSPGWPGSS